MTYLKEKGLIMSFIVLITIAFVSGCVTVLIDISIIDISEPPDVDQLKSRRWLYTSDPELESLLIDSLGQGG